MINKLYEKTKTFIQENYLCLLLYIVLIATLTYPLPYYIYTDGGIINVSDKIEVENSIESKGSYNMCYVEQIQATIPTYLLSKIMPSWEMVKISDISIDKKEDKKDIMLRDKIYLNSANQSAIITAFKSSNSKYKILENRPIVIYILKQAKTDIKTGDEIISIDGISINNRNDILSLIENKNVDERIEIKVLNNGKKYNRYANIIKYNNEKIIGISLENIKTIKTDPSVTFNFTEAESGPSGGLILSLALYDYLIDEDLTSGLKISGTGTIDENGDVSSIGGVKYKLKGAVKNKADVFFVPNGENYKEAMSLQKKYKYKIKIIGVSKFEEAVNYLKSSN